MNKLIKNYIYNLGYQIFLIIIPLITAPYLARVLGDKQMGVYSYINSIVTMITTIGLLGLNSYGYRQVAYVREDKKKLSNLYTNLTIIRIVFVAIIASIYFPLILNTTYKAYFVIQFFLIIAVFIDPSWLFIGLEELGIVTFRNFISKFLTVIFIFLLIKDKNDLYKYFLIYAVISLITTLSLFPVTKKYVKYTKPVVKECFVNIRQSIELFIPQVATTLYLQLDKILIKAITGMPEQVTYYDQAEKFINIPLAVITALSTVMMPRFANLFEKNDRKTIEHYLNLIIRFSLMLAVPMMVGISGIASCFIPWYLGEDFYPVVYALYVLCPLTVINALTHVFGNQYLTATNKTKILCIAYYGAALIDVILNLLLIPQYGYIGAAIATDICLLYSVIVQYRGVKKEAGIESWGKSTLVYAIGSVLMFGIIYIEGKLMGVSIFTTMVQIMSGIAVYVCYLLIIKDEMCLYLFERFIKIRKGEK